MIRALLFVLLPSLCWVQGAENRVRVRFSTTALADVELAARDALPTPGITARAGVASPTRAPWVVANGWRFTRHPEARYRYDLPGGKATLAAAEAFAYGADAMLKIDPADVASLEAILKFFDGLPAADGSAISDLAVVDDGTAVTGEVMNLLARRNLLYDVVNAPSTRYQLNVAVGSREFPVEEAADPNAFALKIRRLITDERRVLRIYGSEVVIARLTGDASRLRLHLINYGGRDIEGLRVRLRGAYTAGDAYVAGAGRVASQDHVIADGATEFSLPRLGVYAAIDLTRATTPLNSRLTFGGR
ncbi:MAG TPA: hypothetical protein VFZ98_02860 [Vicinamibacterales bacterium]